MLKMSFFVFPDLFVCPRRRRVVLHHLLHHLIHHLIHPLHHQKWFLFGKMCIL